MLCVLCYPFAPRDLATFPSFAPSPRDACHLLLLRASPPFARSSTLRVLLLRASPPFVPPPLRFASHPPFTRSSPSPPFGPFAPPRSPPPPASSPSPPLSRAPPPPAILSLRLISDLILPPPPSVRLHASTRSYKRVDASGALLARGLPCISVVVEYLGGSGKRKVGGGEVEGEGEGRRGVCGRMYGTGRAGCMRLVG